VRQGMFDGMDVDSHQARFTGTFDLDEEDTSSVGLDRVAFFVVAVRVEGAVFRTTDDAEVKRINVLKVQDARLASGDMRDEAVQWLAGKAGQSVMDFRERNGVASEEEKAEEMAFMQSRPENVSEDGELIESQVEEPLVDDDEPRDVPMPTDVEVIAGPYRSPGSQRAHGVPAMPVERPGVAKFDPNAFGVSGAPNGRVIVDGPSGPRKDTRLSEFMESGA
jgi:hypothetical protein